MSFPRDKARANLGIDINPNEKIDYLKQNKDKLTYMLLHSAQEKLTFKKEYTPRLKACLN